jgi:hypothetical protein
VGNVVTERKMKVNFKQSVWNGEWEVCDNGKTCDGNGVQVIQHRKEMNGTQSEGNFALSRGHRQLRHLHVNCRLRYRHLCSSFGMWIIGVCAGLNSIYWNLQYT